MSSRRFATTIFTFPTVMCSRLTGNPANLIELYNQENAIPLKVTGILRPKEELKIPVLSPGFAYSEQLADYVLADAQQSDIVTKQMEANYNVLSGQPFSESGTPSSIDFNSKDMVIAMVGGTSIPYMISINPIDFEAKEQVVAYLDKYNEGRSDEEQIIYTDFASNITSMTGGIMDAITLVLIAFSAISLIVSLIMVGIITYISVLERTKEIGVLRALGARKKDITRVFNAETFIIGLSSGVLGIVIAVALIFPINMVIESLSGLENVAQLNPLHAMMLIIISLLLTVMGGFIPAKWAAKKDPVEALRTE